MRVIAALAAVLILGGCHSGVVGPAISGSVSILGIINQDWLAEQGSAVGLKINPAPAPQTASGSTSATSK